MAGEADNLTRDELRRICDHVGGMKADGRDVKTRIVILDVHLGSLPGRLHRLDAHVERIERRLDLAEA